jgi:hypothetical protein
MEKKKKSNRTPIDIVHWMYCELLMYIEVPATVACMRHSEEKACRLECFISIMEQALYTVRCATFHVD